MISEKEKLDKIPEKLKPLANVLLTKQFNEFDENNYEKNKWYRYSPEGALCGRGEKYHGCIKIGTENNLLIVFLGGGCSLNEFTANRPICLYENFTPSFYFDDTWLLTDPIACKGLGEFRDDNPFKNWSMIVVGYANGDFHSGDGEFEYKDLEGNKKTLYHHGYKNYHFLLEKVKKFTPNPENVFVTGFSAGAFATAILTNEICDEFKRAKKIYSLVDAALLVYKDWPDCARNVWHQQNHICKNIITDNIVLDTMTAAIKNNEGRLVQLYTISTRDMLLVEYQGYINHGNMGEFHENDDVYFTEQLKNMINKLVEVNPNINIYLYNKKVEENNPHELTQHCYIMTDDVYSLLNNKKPIDWISDVLDGKVEKIGLDLLK